MRNNRFATFGGGAIIGTLGGLIGLGGAEFRLPLLIGMFGFASLEAVILNKAMSIVVVASALPFRAGTIPFSVLMDHWGVILNLLAGSLLGAWVGAGYAIRLKTETLLQQRPKLCRGRSKPGLFIDYGCRFAFRRFPGWTAGRHNSVKLFTALAGPDTGYLGDQGLAA